MTEKSRSKWGSRAGVGPRPSARQPWAGRSPCLLLPGPCQVGKDGPILQRRKLSSREGHSP